MEQETLELIARGQRLHALASAPGWQDMLDIMDTLVAEAEFHLMNYNGSDKDIIFALQKRSRAMREFLERVQQQVLAAIEAAKEHTQQQASKPLTVGQPGW